MTRPALLVELQKLDGTWVDVSAYVSLTEGLSITRGRNDEGSQPDPAELHLTFEARDKRFTHGDPTYDCRAEQPIYVAVGTAAPASVADAWTDGDVWTDGATWPPGNGPLVPRFFGSVASWPTTWDGPIAGLVVTQIDAYDRLARFGRKSMRSLIEEAYLYDEPAAYWPLGEEEGATSAGDQTGSGVSLVASGAVTFGSAVGPTDGLTAAAISPGGSLVADLTRLALRQERGVTGVSMELAFSGRFNSPTPQTGTLIALERKAAAMWVTISGRSVIVKYLDRSEGFGATPAQKVVTGLDDGTHHLGVQLIDDTVTLFVDGTAVSAGDFPIPVVDGTWSKLTVGSLTIPSLAANPMPITVSHVALYQADGTITPSSRGGAVTGARFGTTAPARLSALTQFAVGNQVSPTNPLLASATTVIGDTRTLVPQAGGDTSALDLMHDVADTEGGLLDIKPAVRGDKVRLITARGLMANATSTATVIPADLVDDVDFTADTKDVVNDATGSRHNGAEQRFVDKDSINAYGTYAGSLPELLVPSDDDVVERLRWEVENHRDVKHRVTSLPIDVQSATPEQAEAFLALDVGSRVQVTGLPSTSPVGSTADLLVQGWTESITASSWAWEGVTGPAADYAVWILDDATWSLLGSTTRLAF